MTTGIRHRQRGAATVIVALLLLGATLLVLLAANRQLLLELRMADNQAQGAAAFEAAEAGLDWAEAMLNTPDRLGPACRPDGSGSESFRERQLAWDGSRWTARTWDRAGTSAALRPACVNDGSGWRCDCPAAAAASLPASGPAFLLQLSATSRPGVVRLRATGCSRVAGECRDDGAGRPEASARVEALLALQPALAMPPATSLSLRPAAVDADRFFATTFGLSRRTWAAQSVVQRVSCSGDCSAAVAAALDRSPLVWIDGDARLAGPLTLGTPQRPVLVVVSGTLQLQGAVALSGMAYAGAIAWSGATGPLRGALVSESTAGGDNLLDLARDADLLAALQTRSGSFVRVPGSWRDF